MKLFWQKFCKLIDVKSFITIYTTIVFGLLVLYRREIPKDFIVIYTTIISFYFGTQSNKSKTDRKE